VSPQICWAGFYCPNNGLSAPVPCPSGIVLFLNIHTNKKSCEILRFPKNFPCCTLSFVVELLRHVLLCIWNFNHIEHIFCGFLLCWILLSVCCHEPNHVCSGYILSDVHDVFASILSWRYAIHAELFLQLVRQLISLFAIVIAFDSGMYCSIFGLTSISINNSSNLTGSLNASVGYCNVGYFCPMNSTAPTICGPGYYCPTSGMSAGIPCAAGT
jgi:hypothetical protein